MFEIDQLDPYLQYVLRGELGETPADDVVDLSAALDWLVRGSSDVEAGTTTFTASTADVDRALDIVRQDWLLANFRANPVILDNHNRGRVVGRAIDVGVRKESGNLELTVEWDLDSPDPLVQCVGHQHLRGYRTSGSVGFKSGKATRRNKLPADHEAFAEEVEIVTPWGPYKYVGTYYERNELLEFSSATVPANVRARHKPPAAAKTLTGERVLEPVDPELVERALEGVPRVVRAELLKLLRTDDTVRRIVLAYGDVRPAPRTPPPTPPQPLKGDGFDHLYVLSEET